MVCYSGSTVYLRIYMGVCYFNCYSFPNYDVADMTVNGCKNGSCLHDYDYCKRKCCLTCNLKCMIFSNICECL